MEPPPPYFPPPESAGGWRLATDDQPAAEAGVDAASLRQTFELQDFLFGGQNWACVVIRKGQLVAEHGSFMGLPTSRFDIWSCTKSFTGAAWGMLLEDSRAGRLPGGHQVSLDSLAYDFLPEAQPLSDPRKARVTIRHLLSMTAGIPGEDHAIYGTPTATGVGPFEHALGHAPSRYGRSTATLAAEPGDKWDYSCAGIATLAMIFAKVAGMEMRDYMQQRLFAKVGIEEASWDVMGGGGHVGPHTTGHIGLHISARELARFGYLCLRGGEWNGEQLLPRWYMEMATRSSQQLNPDYGLTFWTNSAGTHWPAMPRDLFALEVILLSLSLCLSPR